MAKVLGTRRSPHVVAGRPRAPGASGDPTDARLPTQTFNPPVGKGTHGFEAICWLLQLGRRGIAALYLISVRRATLGAPIPPHAA